MGVTDRCIGCGECINEICFVNAIQVKDNQAKISESCRGCGRCVEICPNQAIEISIENPDFLSLAVDKLTSVVDVS